MKYQFIVLPYGGLGNRMRVVASAVAFSKARGYDLKIIWINDRTLGCDLESLFKSVGMEYSLEDNWFKLFFFKYFFRFRIIFDLHSLISRIGSRFYKYFVLERDVLDNARDIGAIVTKMDGDVFVATCHNFYPFEGYGGFLLADHMELRLAALKSKLGSNYYGVHIRGTDHKIAKRESPFHSYVSKIAELLTENPKLLFFVASDEQSYKDHLISVFSDRIISFPSLLERNSARGCEDALIELYCLGNAKGIICSVHSSFSEIATKLGKLEKDIHIIG